MFRKGVMRERIPGALWLPGILLLSACVSLSRGRQDEPRPEAVQVRVENWGWLDARVYVLRDEGTAPRRLGLVTSMGHQTFEIPHEIYATTGRMELSVMPVGRFVSHRTGPFPVSPGDVVRLQLQTEPRFSAILIR